MNDVIKKCRDILATPGGVLAIFILFIAIPAFCIFFPGFLLYFEGYLFGIDTWVYAGFMWNFPGQLELFSGTYYPTRLPWILPGYLLVKVFGLIPGGIILRLIFFLMSAFSLFYYSKRCYDSLQTMLIVIFAISLPYFIAYYSWDYPNGAGIAYAMLALCMLEYSIVSEKYSSICWFMFGIASILMVWTNLFLIVFAPGMVLYLVCRKKMKELFHWKWVFLVLAGAGSVTFILCIINFFLGGDFLFFMPTVRFAITSAQEKSPWAIPGYSWMLHAPFLVLPLIGFVCAVFNLFEELFRKKSCRSRRAAFAIFMIVSCLLFLSNHIKSGGGILHIDYYLNYLMVFSVISIFDLVFVQKDFEKRFQLKNIPVIILFFLILLSIHKMLSIEKICLPYVMLGLVCIFIAHFLKKIPVKIFLLIPVFYFVLGGNLTNTVLQSKG